MAVSQLPCTYVHEPAACPDAHGVLVLPERMQLRDQTFETPDTT